LASRNGRGQINECVWRDINREGGRKVRLAVVCVIQSARDTIPSAATTARVSHLAVFKKGSLVIDANAFSRPMVNSLEAFSG
jgi:hypothetical protein